MTCNSATNEVDIDVQRRNKDILGYSSPQTVYNSHVLPKIKTKYFLEGVVSHIKELKSEEAVAFKKKKKKNPNRGKR